MFDPVSVAGNAALTDGIKFLYEQLTELLRRRRDRDQDKKQIVVRPTATADVLDGWLSDVSVSSNEVDEAATALAELRAALANYADGFTDVGTHDAAVREVAGRARALLEALYGQRLTLAGEDKRQLTGTPLPRAEVASRLQTFAALGVGAVAAQTIAGQVATSGGIIVSGNVGGLYAGPIPQQSPPIIAAPCQLLGDTPNFIGRQAELDRLRKAIAARGGSLSGTVAIHAIDGMAGVGKTTLAVHLAHELVPRYPHGQLFLDLHAYSAEYTAVDPRVALGRLLGALGVPGNQIPESLGERAALWRSMLAERRVLVVLDNALDNDQVEPLLPGVSDSLVLITSRNRLVGLGDVPSLALDVFTADEAVALFAKIAGSDRTMTQSDAAGRVAADCSYLPLAIKLAASQLAMHPSWSVDDLADDLGDVRHRLDRLRAGKTRRIEAAFSLSYRDLDPDLQRMFRSLGLHPGPVITPDDAAALADCSPADARRMLDDLYSLHLIDDFPVGGIRYRLHDLLREYAASRAVRDDAEDDRVEAVGRLLDAYLYSAATADRWLHSLNHRPVEMPRPPRENSRITSFEEALAWMDHSYLNLIACASYAQHVGLEPHSWRIPEMLGFFLRIRGHLHEAFDVHAAALTAAQGQPSRFGEATALYNLGVLDRVTGNAVRARARLDGALESYRLLDDHLGEAETLRALGILDRLTGDYPRAKERLDRALAMHSNLGNQLGEAWVLGAQGILERLIGKYVGARDCFTRAFATFCDLGDRIGEAWMLNELGSLDRLTGRYADAQGRLHKAMAVFGELGDHFSQAWTLCQLAVIDRLTGEYAEARKRLDHALGITAELGSRFAEARTSCELGVLDRLGGDYLNARTRLDHALAVYRELGDGLGQAWALCELGVLDRLTGDYLRAGSRLDGGLAVYRDLGDRLGEAWTLSALGVVDRLTGNYPSANSRLDAVLTAYRSLGNPVGEAWTLSALGVLDRLNGDYPSARARLERAITQHRQLGNRPGQAWSLGALGVVERLHGDHRKARSRLDAARAIYRKLGNRLGEAWTLGELGTIDRLVGEANSAFIRLSTALQIYDKLGDRLGVAETRLEMGELLASDGRVSDCRSQWEQSLGIFEDLGLVADAGYVRSRLQ